jgi:hypothetical protein
VIALFGLVFRLFYAGCMVILMAYGLLYMLNIV